MIGQSTLFFFYFFFFIVCRYNIIRRHYTQNVKKCVGVGFFREPNSLITIIVTNATAVN